MSTCPSRLKGDAPRSAADVSLGCAVHPCQTGRLPSPADCAIACCAPLNPPPLPQLLSGDGAGRARWAACTERRLLLNPRQAVTGVPAHTQRQGGAQQGWGSLCATGHGRGRTLPAAGIWAGKREAVLILAPHLDHCTPMQLFHDHELADWQISTVPCCLHLCAGGRNVFVSRLPQGCCAVAFW